MKGNSSSEINKYGPELIFGLVGAVGTDLGNVSDSLVNALNSVGFTSTLIKISSLIGETHIWKKPEIKGQDEHVEEYQKAGNLFRKTLGRADALGLAAIVAIRNERKKSSHHSDKPNPRHAYILRSLKRPEEVDLLRKVYGSGFFLIAAFSPEKKRVDQFANEIAISRNKPLQAEKYRSKAEKLIDTDQVEAHDEFGQNVRDTYPMADVFVDASDRPSMGLDIDRFINILFGYPFHTPRREEYVMFHARAAALRSADPSRQVGAAIANDDGNVIAVGTNEVPKANGGLYWEGDSPDRRDFKLDVDANLEMKKTALEEILLRLEENNWLSKTVSSTPKEQLRDKVVPLMKGTMFMGIGEFGRMVHAEMAAMLDAARRGAPLQRKILYTTTFPCNNCAKHIIACGISRVIYVEPYPKSLAKILHSDEILDDNREVNTGKTAFASFVGIAPRQYLNLFEMVKRKGGKKAHDDWNVKKKEVLPRYPDSNSHLSYVPREKEAVVLLQKPIKKRKGA